MTKRKTANLIVAATILAAPIITLAPTSATAAGSCATSVSADKHTMTAKCTSSTPPTGSYRVCGTYYYYTKGVVRCSGYVGWGKTASYTDSGAWVDAGSLRIDHVSG